MAATGSVRRALAGGLVAALVLCTATARSFTASPALTLPPFETPPGATLKVVRTHEYVMSGAVRPLLFWISRDDIGLARIVWRGESATGRGYELLVGTDPARAPRGLNRWGLISEETSGAGGSLLAIMTGSHETSYEAESSAASKGPGDGDFSVIRSSMADRSVTWQLSRMRTPRASSVRQVGDVLDCLRAEPTHQEFRRTVQPAVRPGFLVAVADLLDETIGAAARGSGTPSRSVEYAFGSRTYSVRLRDAKPVTVSYDGAPMTALRIRFETRENETRESSTFELTTPASGGLAGVPLAVEWQPRWWLKVRLRLAGVR